MSSEFHHPGISWRRFVLTPSCRDCILSISPLHRELGGPTPLPALPGTACAVRRDGRADPVPHQEASGAAGLPCNRGGSIAPARPVGRAAVAQGLAGGGASFPRDGALHP